MFNKANRDVENEWTCDIYLILEIKCTNDLDVFFCLIIDEIQIWFLWYFKIFVCVFLRIVHFILVLG